MTTTIEGGVVVEFEPKVVLDPGDPLPSARQFLERKYTRHDERTLHHHAGVFYGWNGNCYPEADNAAIRAELYQFLEGAVRLKGTGEQQPFKPTQLKVSNVLDALKAAANIPKNVTAPAWLDHTPDLPPDQILSCRNGLLFLPTREVMPRTPTFYVHNGLSFNYDANAPDPVSWLRFLDDLWPDDTQAISTLQDIFGNLLTADTLHQKLFMIVGPKRSGKGTIGRVITGLLGQSNVCAPTLASLGTNFGLAPLVNRPLAIISDARLGGRADQHAIAERLLSISGEDSLTLDRKFIEPWTGRLPTRFLILTNELPRLADASGALASRFIVLKLTKSFYGREDQNLTDRLLTELPSILNWSIEGWERLRDRGHFVQPRSSADAIAALEDLSSPVGAFIRERCEVAVGAEIEPAHLFDAWKNWCEEHGRDRPGTAQTFGRDLRAVLPSVEVVQPRNDTGGRYRAYSGITLK